MRVLADIRGHADNGMARYAEISRLSAPFGVLSSDSWALFVWSYVLAWFLVNN